MSGGFASFGAAQAKIFLLLSLMDFVIWVKGGTRMRKYAIKLDDYGISKYRYYELSAFCRQYADKRMQLAELRGLGAVANDGMPHGNGVGDPTARKGEAALALSEDIKLIEDTAREVDPLNWAALLKNVTDGLPYEQMQVFCGRRQFYESRRKFFWLLDQRKSG